MPYRYPLFQVFNSLCLPVGQLTEPCVLISQLSDLSHKVGDPAMQMGKPLPHLMETTRQDCDSSVGEFARLFKGSLGHGNKKACGWG